MGKGSIDKLKRRAAIAYLLVMICIGQQILSEIAFQFKPPVGPRPLSVFLLQLTVWSIAAAALSRYFFSARRLMKSQSKMENTIHERERTREELMQTKARFQDVINLLPNYIAELDLNFNFIYVNDAAFKTFGYTEADVRDGLSVLALIHPDDRERAVASLLRINSETLPIPGEYRVLTKDGKELTTIIQTTLRYEHGEPSSYLSCVTDITERKKAEVALQESENKYRTLFESSMDGIFLIEMSDEDQEGYFVDCNQAACLMNGYSREEIVGQRPSFFTLRQTWVEESFYSDIKEGKKFTQEFIHCRKDGSLVYIESAAGAFTINGKLYRLGVDRDITARKQIESALRESEAKYRTLFENSLDGIFLIEQAEGDEEGVIVDCNEAACAMNGYTRDEIIGRKPSIFCSQGVQLAEKDFFAELRDGNSVVREFIHCRKDGSTYPIESVTHQIVIDGKKYLLGIDRDISARKTAENALRESEKRYRALFESSPDGIFLVEIREDDLDHWNIVDCNDIACVMNGYAREELIGQNINIVNEKPVSHQEMRVFLERLRREKSFSWEETHRHKDGTLFSVEIRGTLIELNGKEYLIGLDRDITTRKKTEKALLESEAKYRALFDYSVEGILIIDIQDMADWKIVDCNAAVCQMNGYSREELIGHSLDIINLTRSSYQERCKKLDRIRKNGFLMEEYLHRHKDGHIIPIETTSSLIMINGQAYLLGMDRDVSERKQAEAALRESEEKYRALVENAEAAICTITWDGEYTFVNKNACENMGWTAGETPGKMMWDAFPREIADRQMANVRKVLETGRGLVSEAATVVRNEPRWYRTSIQCVKDGQGQNIALVISSDITKLKNAEAELAAEKNRLAVTLSSIGEGVIATDMEGNIVLINQAAEHLTDWSAQEAIGKPMREVFRTETISNDSTGGTIGDLSEDVILIARNGRERNIVENGATIRDKEGNALGMVFVFRDVTGQRKNEQELLKTQKLESLGVLAGGIAHDFNNIMTSLLLNVQLCKILSAQKADLSKHMTDMEKAIMRATNLTGQLLTFAKGGAPVKKRIQVDELVRETVEFTLHGLQSTCVFLFDQNLPMIEADEGQISQVMNNLVLNADQAMPNGGEITVGVHSIWVHPQEKVPLKPGRYVRISVKDQGIGIPKENLNKIFDPYFTTKHGGNGLGLASCFSIIKGHNGYIDVESSKGKGAVFTVYLPAIPEEQATFAIPKESDLRGGGRVLLMDDDEAIRLAMGDSLRKYGFEVMVSANGEEAIRKYIEAKDKDNPYDVLILDLTIPGGIGGLEVLDKLKMVDPAVKAVVASGYSNSPVMANYQKFGFVGVVSKPFKMEAMVRMLNEIIEVRENSL